MPNDSIALTKAHEVWSMWISNGTVRPTDYDYEFADAVAGIIGAPSGADLLRHLQTSKATALELIIAALNALRPFGGMLADLLAMYEQIGARANENESLRIKIGNEDEGIDESLHYFREMVESVHYLVASVSAPFDESEWLWSCPLRPRKVEVAPEPIRDWLDHYQGDGDLGSYQMPIPPVPACGVAAVDKLASDMVEVLEGHRHLLLNYAPSLRDLRNVWTSAGRDELTSEDHGMTRTFFFAATDHWLATHVRAVHEWVANIRSTSQEIEAVNETVQAMTKWLDAAPLQRRILGQVVRQLSDVLSLPAWRKRHEIYSAWIVTLVKEALPKERVQFIVRDGIFAMPFRAVHLADIFTSAGIVELWSELKSPIIDPVGHGRKNAIQPDYRFVRSTRQSFQSTTARQHDAIQDTLLAIEVKQYFKAAKKNPGQALADYTKGLPNAQVFLAAYGPVSANVLDLVPAENRSRAEVFRDVRPFHEERSKLIEAISNMLPPPRSSKSRLYSPPFLAAVLTWSPLVHDLDLYVYRGETDEVAQINYQSPVSFYGHLIQDAFDGGPETVELFNADEETRILVHSHQGVPLADAQPKLQIAGPNGVQLFQLPSDFPSNGTTWHAATISAGNPIDVQLGTGCVRAP
ncbi:hypothetical protein [Arthrobacter sp. zg-Y750]|uniref:hypothetical protein n=1 Tax=Arthrobacter sp. zg-Y750 TaxID=2894189 RepID=UPI001E2CFA32|nr:hypothetical protein [Arthrobacter sp. zg-Y750]MCC9177887.1 hypothetical protein [Arthrobacter sp. zg-Y750]